MKLVASLSMVRARGACRPWWPEGAERLIAIILEPEPSADLLLAYGIAPSPQRGRSRIVFEARLRRAELGAFIREIVDGEPLPAGREGIQVVESRRPTATIIGNPELAPSMRNLVFTLAGALDDYRDRAERATQRARRMPDPA
ncbi:MAG: hypothetical protein E6J91_17350 [Deltaproteobacteria bacterium]|nr:MAG: hypothetical protein E6J91_17350 [Deltaproteobacteria bacterium]